MSDHIFSIFGSFLIASILLVSQRFLIHFNHILRACLSYLSCSFIQDCSYFSLYDARRSSQIWYGKEKFGLRSVIRSSILYR